MIFHSHVSLPEVLPLPLSDFGCLLLWIHIGPGRKAEVRGYLTESASDAERFLTEMKAVVVVTVWIGK